MAVYEFSCEKCHRRFTVAESYQEHERHHEKCPKCGSKKVRQLISPIYTKTSKKS